ncbi:MAG: hypothetical protein AAGH17_09620 [Pseudomonadota bacterium]
MNTAIHAIILLLVVGFIGLLALFIAAIVAWQRVTEIGKIDAGDQTVSWRIMARGILDGPPNLRRAVLRFRILCALQAGVLVFILAAAFGWLPAMAAALVLLSAVALTKPAVVAA